MTPRYRLVVTLHSGYGYSGHNWRSATSLDTEHTAWTKRGAWRLARRLDKDQGPPAHYYVRRVGYGGLCQYRWTRMKVRYA